MLAELGQAVRERRVSAVELVTESLARIERLHPTLNAVTADSCAATLLAPRPPRIPLSIRMLATLPR